MIQTNTNHTKPKNLGRRKPKFVVYLPVLMIIPALLIGWFLYRSRPIIKEETLVPAIPFADVAEIQSRSERVMVYAYGTVIPSRQLLLHPQVTGNVVKVHAAFSDGGRFQTGDTLLQIDSSDYRLALIEQLATVSDAEVKLALEYGNQAVAKADWDQTSPSMRTGADQQLILRKPHLKRALATLESAKAGLARAELDLKRTTIVAPFNGLVQNRQIALGSQVSPQAPVGTLIGTDTFWVRVALPVDRLDWIDIPGFGNARGATVEIHHGVGLDQEQIHHGKVIRLLGDLEKNGRMARILIAVNDPLHLKSKTAKGLPLLLGANVQVAIQGKSMPMAFRIPRSALRDENQIFLLDEMDRLVIQSVQVIWRDAEAVYVADDLSGKLRLVLNDIPFPVAGMQLQPNPLTQTAWMRPEALGEKP